MLVPEVTDTECAFLDETLEPPLTAFTFKDFLKLVFDFLIHVLVFILADFD